MSIVASLTPALSSLWDGLNPHLIASFYQVDRQGKRIDSAITVKAPLVEAEMEISLNWQSPFEQSGPESKAPALLAMLQSGTLQPFVDAVLGKPKEGEQASGAQKASADFLKQFEGRTGITKLNSTQVFTGMPPVKFSVQALFRAWRDAATEVEAPFEQLMQWSLPEKLSTDGTVLPRLVESAKGETGSIEALLPSLSPVMIALQYKGRTFAPLVIESIGMPLSSPIDADGNFVELLVPMTICSLTALDKEDWANVRKVAM
ncbi:hypothetical protein [Pusillimonas noertemannii]|uniref:Uncharacterized protein n=1 Tax=Pusillimonas noertemannii TaxID=305977 RepID=A0A2U1CMF6_9BURK|nr:hypothetical protein [Pusillimonas noertemannii]NYT68798.1 hypothetical protein [Pusillimonas noertemannii]PVY62178.1 hypothetical protein C7440_1671 [Pusillimonas noertemannii]TFL10834.1 hypothetical protein CSC72_10000 [Pusillimonas noertemannii]